MQAAMQPGTVLLGKYIVERVLGTGGMGVVVAARHMELGELFAIKLMLEAALDQADLIERFLREARASARTEDSYRGRAGGATTRSRPQPVRPRITARGT